MVFCWRDPKHNLYFPRGFASPKKLYLKRHNSVMSHYCPMYKYIYVDVQVYDWHKHISYIYIYLPVVVSNKVATSADQPITFRIRCRGLPTTEASWGSWAFSWKSDLAISFTNWSILLMVRSKSDENQLRLVVYLPLFTTGFAAVGLGISEPSTVTLIWYWTQMLNRWWFGEGMFCQVGRCWASILTFPI